MPETRIVNVAVHCARSASVISAAPSWWLVHTPSGCASAVTMYLPGELGAVYVTLRSLFGVANVPPAVPVLPSASLSSQRNTSLEPGLPGMLLSSTSWPS